MSFDSHPDRPFRSSRDRRLLIEAVRDSGSGTQETNWLEWKRELPAGKKARAVTARAILGFANRPVDVALRNAGGCGYLLAGVEPGGLLGTPVVDGQALDNQLRPYLGDQVPWSANYEEVDGLWVLVVQIDPPEAGDPPFPARKAFNDETDRALSFRDGALFVRGQASTEQATAADIDRLTARARSGGTLAPLKLDVEPIADLKLDRFDASAAAIEAYGEDESRRLLGPLRRQQSDRTAPMRSVMAAMGEGDRRRPQSFEQAVDRYVAELEAQLPELLRARALEHGIARLELKVANPTDDAIAGIEMTLELDASEVDAVYASRDALVGASGMPRAAPKPPRPWGTVTYQSVDVGLQYADFGRRMRVRPTRFYAPSVERAGDHWRVRLSTMTLLAEEQQQTWPVYLLLGPDADQVTVRWEAASMTLPKRLRGELTLSPSLRVWTVAELLEEPPDLDD